MIKIMYATLRIPKYLFWNYEDQNSRNIIDVFFYKVFEAPLSFFYLMNFVLYQIILLCKRYILTP